MVPIGDHWTKSITDLATEAALETIKTTNSQKPEMIAGKLSSKLGKQGATALSSVNGSLQYISSERPDVYGKIAVSLESMNDIENQTWQTVATANSILEDIILDRLDYIRLYQIGLDQIRLDQIR